MRRGGLFWGGVLILLGALFLLENLDILQLNFNLWGLFWPLLLIWLGIQFVFRPSWRPGAAEVEHLTIPLKGIEEAQIRVNYGAGELHIHGATAPDELLDGSFGSGVTYEARGMGNKADVKLRPPSDRFPFGLWWRAGQARRWSFGLNNAIPLALEVKTGASKAVLNLTDLQLRELRLQTGASETRINLPAAAGYTKVVAETGMAEVRLQVPPAVAACIYTSGGLSEINVDQDRFPRQGTVYQSPGYDAAENKVDIHLTVGLGSAKIR
jgi:hypothetical protein